MSDSYEHEVRELRSLYWSERDPDGRGFAPLADACRRAGNLEEAKELLAEGLERLPQFASGHVVAARLHLDLGDFGAAATSLDRVLELDGENAEALETLASIREDEGRPDDALLLFKRLAVVTPENTLLTDRIRSLEETLDVASAASNSVDIPDSASDWTEYESEESTDVAVQDVADPLTDDGMGVDDVAPSEPFVDDAVSADDLATAEPFAEDALSMDDLAPAEPFADEAVSMDDLAPAEPFADEAVSMDDLAPAEPFADEAVSTDDLVAAEPFADEAVSMDDPVAAEPFADEAVSMDDLVAAEPFADEAVSMDDLAPAEPFADDASNGIDAGTGDFPPDAEGIPSADPYEASVDTSTDDARQGAVHEAEEPAAPDEEAVAIDELVESSPWTAIQEDDDDGVGLDDELYTRTLAELYADQGLYNRAVDVYEHLVKESPGDPDLRVRLEELESLANADARSASALDDIESIGASQVEESPGAPDAWDPPDEPALVDSRDATGDPPSDRPMGPSHQEEDLEVLAADLASGPDETPDVSTPFAWSEADADAVTAEGEPGRPVSDYFNDLLTWQPSEPAPVEPVEAVSIGSLAPEVSEAGATDIEGAGAEEAVVPIASLAPDAEVAVPIESLAPAKPAVDSSKRAAQFQDWMRRLRE